MKSILESVKLIRESRKGLVIRNDKDLVKLRTPYLKTSKALSKGQDVSDEDMQYYKAFSYALGVYKSEKEVKETQEILVRITKSAKEDKRSGKKREWDEAIKRATKRAKEAEYSFKCRKEEKKKWESGKAKSESISQAGKVTLSLLSGGIEFIPKFRGMTFILKDGVVYKRGAKGSDFYRKVRKIDYVSELRLKGYPGVVHALLNLSGKDIIDGLIATKQFKTKVLK